MQARGINSPLTSSTGRIFDSVASLIGLRNEVIYEGQAAIELEVAASAAEWNNEPYPYDIQAGDSSKIDVKPMIHAIVEDIQKKTSPALIASRFHQTIVSVFAECANQARKSTGLDRVVLSGGVFQNRLLLDNLITQLDKLQFRVFTNHLVPPNDGGISLGQIAIAAAIIRNKENE
jgi:hydrogenase maturation protein HypF